MDASDEARLSFAMHLAAMNGGARTSRAIPTRVALPDLIPGVADANEISRAWRRADDSLVVMVGAGRDGPVSIVLQGAARHMLVAGTPRSRQPPLPDTLALGMAAPTSPPALDLCRRALSGGNL